MHAHQNLAKARHHELTRAAAQSPLAVQTRRRASHRQHAAVVGATATDPTFECLLTHEGDGLASRRHLHHLFSNPALSTRRAP